MVGKKSGVLRCCVLAGAGMLALALATSRDAAAGIAFGKSGPFEACLDAAYDAWALAQAELVVNEDARAQSLDDPVVAAWTISALADCRKRAGPGDAASEDTFARHMSRWRQLVFDLAAGIRRRGQSD